MVILDLVDTLGSVAEGETVTLPVRSAEEVAAAKKWCDQTANTFVSSSASAIVVRRGRRLDPLLELPADRRPGYRLWIYTNFDCNLACDYCCVRSSPRTARRALGLPRIQRLANEAAAAGVSELILTGGEPFLLTDLGEIATACAAALPTTLLTNGMLFRGRRLHMLRMMPRERLRLQISLDSADPAGHDAHRGAGSWARAFEGIEIALREGFAVRVAATLHGTHPAEEQRLRGYLTDLGIADEDQILRPLAKRGAADDGLVLTTETLVPEITVTAEGVYWHPVGADDADQLVTTELFPLDRAIATVQQLFRAQRETTNARARTFPCA
jgi:pyruvate-formate lyase-activating enzyme